MYFLGPLIGGLFLGCIGAGIICLIGNINQERHDERQQSWEERVGFHSTDKFHREFYIDRNQQLLAHYGTIIPIKNIICCEHRTHYTTGIVKNSCTTDFIITYLEGHNKKTTSQRYYDYEAYAINEPHEIERIIKQYNPNCKSYLL